MKNKCLIIGIFCLIMCIVFACSKDENEIKCDGVTHNSEWIVTTEATCTTLGSKNLVCKDCGEILTTAKINYLEHDMIILEGVSATCTTDGLTQGSKCKVCNEVYEEQKVIKAFGHSYVLDKEKSTDTLNVYVCSTCGDTKEEANNTGCTSHEAGEWVTVESATCIVQGKEEKKCTKCDTVLESRYTGYASHDIVKTEGKAATCTTDGYTESEKCKVCDKDIVLKEVIKAFGHNYIITDTLNPTTQSDGYIEYTCTTCGDSYREIISDLNTYDPNQATTLVVKDGKLVISNDNGGVVTTNNGDELSITITLAGEYDITGSLKGNIIVKVDEESKVILNLRDVTIESSISDPIFIESGNKVEISAKSETTNIINDLRTISDDAVGGAIYSKVDLEIKGKGTLKVTSSYNNGIATTKDLEIKNLILEANAVNNALKGNDSLTIESGTIKAISSSGDALKTENTDVSDKGNQRGIITIYGGDLELYAACDAIDASYDVIINGGNINIFTEKYSEYSGEVEVTTPDVLYIRVSGRSGLQSNAYKYSAKFINEDNTYTWVNGKSTNQSGTFEFDKPVEAKYVVFFCYNNQQTQGNEDIYSYKSDQLTIPSNYDEYYVSSKDQTNKTLIADWTVHGTQSSGPGGGPMRPGGGPGGGPNEGNNNKAEYSCKGIKADNSITINDGVINIKSRDDAIHTNSDVQLANGSYGVASITIIGGTIKIYSDDDAIHADSTLTIDGGNILIESSYEGIEGNQIYFNGGVVQIKSSDDGINAKNSLNFNGSIVYLDSQGDGIDSNNSIVMKAGVVLALGPTNGGNGVIDYDRSFTLSGGLLLAIGCSGMNQKPTAQTGATSTSKSISTNTSSYVTVTSNGEVVACIKVTKTSQNHCVLAYSNNDYPGATANVVTSVSVDLVNGLYYIK